jgi:hypothetical protein
MNKNQVIITSIIGALGLLLGTILGNYLSYKGAEKNANAQITAAWEDAQAQIESAQEAAQAQIKSAQEVAKAQITSVWAPIRATETAEFRLTQIILSSTPYLTSTSIPVSTPTPKYSDAIVVINNFYSWINDAGNKADLSRSWNLETTGIYGYQCKEAAGCEFPNFQDFWWKWKTYYKLYDCGSNIVDVELQYYSRNPILATTPESIFYIRYQLIDVNGPLKINGAAIIEGPGADCPLIISTP